MLNGQQSSFPSMPVRVSIESLDGNVEATIMAQTVDNVVGQMPIVDWNRHTHRWKHLQGVQFHIINHKKPVDLLIGLDNAPYHVAKAEIIGNEGEPIARLTKLGWTCVGNSNPGTTPRMNTGQSFLINGIRASSNPDHELNDLVRRLWEIQEVSPAKAQQLDDDERQAVTSVQQSIKSP